MSDGISLDVAFNVDKQTLEQAVSAYVDAIGNSMQNTAASAEDFASAIEAAVRPMEELVQHADSLEKSFAKLKDLTQAIKENVTSTRMQAGIAPSSIAGQFGGGGGGGGGGGLLGGGIIQNLIGALPALAGGALLGGQNAGQFAATQGRDMVQGAIRSVLGNGAADFFSRFIPQATLSQAPQGGGAAAANNLTNPIQALIGGANPLSVIGGMSGAQMAGTMGGMSGLMRGLGSGPIGLFANIAGGAAGAQAGYQAADRMGFGTMGRMAGAWLGGRIMPDMTNSFIQQSMSMYPGYLSTMASMAQVGLAGGDVRTMRGLGATRFGYSPEEMGPAFASLFRGFGGGELTRDTQRTAMAYSRAYGVDMGAIGQSIGGLLNAGGGGQSFSAAQREETMVRVMADAVAEGFGRRLPEFSAAVGSGVSTAMSGPAIVRQSAMPELISSISRLQGRIASQQGVGLQGAQRFLSPLLSAPGRALEGFMSGGGDPFSMQMMWSGARSQFGNDPMAFMDSLAAAQENPFSEQAMSLHRAPLETILSNSPNDMVAMASLRNYMPDISYTQARQVISRGREAMEDGSLGDDDMLQIFTGIEETQRTEAEDTRETMRDIQRSGEAIMREQLSAMQANAAFAQAQLSIAAAGASTARDFYRIQHQMSLVQASLMRVAGVSSMVQSLGNIANPEFAAQLRESGTAPEMVEVFMRRMLRTMTENGLNLDQLAEQVGADLPTENPFTGPAPGAQTPANTRGGGPRAATGVNQASTGESSTRLPAGGGN